MDIGRLLNDSNCDAFVDDADCGEDESQQLDLRVGKWTQEEVRYATALVKHFVAGTLAIPSGTSLRGFLAHKLHCSAMRVSTKLATDALGGFKSTKKLGLKRFFPMEGLSAAQRDQVVRELQRLRADFVRVAQLDELAMSDEPTTRGSVSSTSSSMVTSDDEGSDAPWRVGSWSHDEQLYACALIEGFMRGRVNVAEGTTLRAYLSERLCCNPMRISKKLATGKMASTAIPRRLGSVTYHLQASDPATVKTTEQTLERLRLNCFPTAPRYVEEPAAYYTQPGRPNTYAPASSAPWQPPPGGHTLFEASLALRGSEFSPLHVGVKRRMSSSWPQSSEMTGFTLPPLASAVFDKRPRLMTHPFY